MIQLLLPVGDHMSKSELIAQQCELAETDHNQKIGKLWESLTSALFEDHADLEAVTIKGWTPSFNDGDICEHSTEVDMDFQGGVWNHETNSKIYDSIRQFHGYLQRVYDTNWMITLTRTSDGVSVEQSDYDCGY